VTYDVQSPEAARLWDYLPNWANGFDVRRSFKTDIAVSRSKLEQRRAIRPDPRISIEYRTVVQDADLRSANHFLRAWQNKPTIIPDYTRWARTTASASGGASAIVIDPLPFWIAAGQNLNLCGEENERVLVDSVAGTTVNLADPLSNAWPLGSVVRPTFFGLLESRIGTSRRTYGTAEITVSLDCYPGGEPPRAAGTAWATLGSREVFTLQPDFAAPPSLNAVWPMDRVDFSQGRTAEFRPVAAAERMLEADFNGMDVTTAGQAEQFFDRHKGRRNAFYMPTWEKDFVLAATALSGSSAFLASGSDLAADFGAVDYSAVEEAVAVFLTSGTVIYRRVSDIGASGGNSLVTVGSAWGTELNAGNVARICLMPLWRFASDDMTTSWQTPLRAGTRLPFQQVRA
jgi:hypothetical protein